MDAVTVLFGVGVALTAIAFLRGVGAISLPGERRADTGGDAPYGWEPRRPRNDAVAGTTGSDRPSEIRDLVEHPSQALTPPTTDGAVPPGRGEREVSEESNPPGPSVDPSTLRVARALVLALASDAASVPADRLSSGVVARLSVPRTSVEIVVRRLCAAGFIEPDRSGGPGPLALRLTDSGRGLLPPVGPA